MDRMSRAQSTRFRFNQFVTMLVVVAAAVMTGIAISFATRTTHPELSKIFAGGAATLLFGSMLGGVVSLLVQDFDRRRLQRAAQLDFVSNVLSDLKDVYDSVDRGRTLIRAHRSARTYGDEMRNLIEARVKLLNVVRALKFDERGVSIGTVGTEVARMEQYLKSLIGEFEKQYKDISRLQSVYEARMKKAVQQADSIAQKDPELPRNEPWEAIAALPFVSDFIALPDDAGASRPGVDTDYNRDFLAPLDGASSELRTALRKELT
jgi:hypothetical protein